MPDEEKITLPKNMIWEAIRIMVLLVERNEKQEKRITLLMKRLNRRASDR